MSTYSYAAGSAAARYLTRCARQRQLHTIGPVPYKTYIVPLARHASLSAGRQTCSHTCDQGTLPSEIGEATDDGSGLAARTGVLNHLAVCSGEQPACQPSTSITACAISQVQQPIHRRGACKDVSEDLDSASQHSRGKHKALYTVRNYHTREHACWHRMPAGSPAHVCCVCCKATTPT
jgi:hypothetical protein